ncbi:NERD domain-containing protein [Flavobacterium sp. UBA4854]|uniref:NERD domain-containing protein n=1 Tax=Flavobacterium sp. UBA4854 TaxID=1946548 RepID=UPI00257AF025|nr:NERD domain-containing protein [Flavobacterium sp. UBA4854]
MELTFLILIFLLMFIFGFYKSKIKGIIGEKKVSLILYFFDKSDYKVINNVVLKTGAITTQIDHIVISSFGVFVIETKNYKGWIVGYENSKYWTQVIYKYKTKFYNPILQNEGHIKALKNCLKVYSDLEYISIVVFCTKANIKVDTNIDVINVNLLIKTIKKYSRVNLSETDKENIFQKINNFNLVKSVDQREHINSVKRRINNPDKKIIQEIKCPRCGNKLIERQGKYGSFFGCKSYPKCDFTQKTF